jgi:Asp-tRNA(Asn)/Glu-tRNA(Gln) amidotransferase A subunit family amidase
VSTSYDPKSYRGLTFADITSKFQDGSDSPNAYLERCLDVIDEREPVVQAYVALNRESARAAAEASSSRWKAGTQISAVDGMPVSIKDLLETKDMPTELGCEALRGTFPKRDNAAVWALRRAGAIILGKTVTAELGGSHPGPTTNPFDTSRTPGGSSSGSAAAVAAGMVPGAIGSQVGGSIIRPAGYCGNVALKPTQGGINRGERMATSMSTHGVHANSIEDMWNVAMAIVSRVGGDRGELGIQGPLVAPAGVKPERLLVLESAGWAQLDDASEAAFEALLESLQSAGITIVRRSENVVLEQLEQAIAEAERICYDITCWENQWGIRAIIDQHSDGVSARAKASIKRADSMSVAHYQLNLVERRQAQLTHELLAGEGDAIISPSCPGPAPHWSGDVPGQPLARRPTGDAIFNYPSSMLFAPCVTMPLLAVGGMPVGVQLTGQQHQDARMTALARWILDHITPVSQSA